MTKTRRCVLDDAYARVLQGGDAGGMRDFSAELREFNGEHDHVHLLVEYPPKIAISALVNSLKGISAWRLHAQFTGPVKRMSYMALVIAVLPRSILPRCPLNIAEWQPNNRSSRASPP